MKSVSQHILKRGARQTLSEQCLSGFQIGNDQRSAQIYLSPNRRYFIFFYLQTDADENLNFVNLVSKAELDEMEKEVLKWYRFQTDYLGFKYPNKGSRTKE